MQDYSLTTTAAARLASVAPSTIKRWADEGHLRGIRTAGGHRRFDKKHVEDFLRAQRSSAELEKEEQRGWIETLLSGDRYRLDSELLGARSRHGSWHGVADELCAVLVEMGHAWARGDVTIAEEHVASDALSRALARMCDGLPRSPFTRKAVLACVPNDEHTLGLSLAQLCLKERGRDSIWLGRNTPVSELVRVLRAPDVELVVLVASSAFESSKKLHEIANDVGLACENSGKKLILGGGGAWPSSPARASRLHSFGSLNETWEART